MPEPLVYVLVINWNGMDHLETCFRSLMASDYPNARFLLIDNASTDGSAEYVEREFGSDSRVEILRLDENLGWSGGNNAGMEYALERDADYILLLNNDTSTDATALTELVRLAEGDDSIGALAPKLLMFNEPQILNSCGLIASTIGAAWDRGIGRLDGPKWSGHAEVIGVCGAGFFIRSETLRKTGLLPTDFEIYLDDLDLSLRIWNAGYRVVACPEAVIRHKFSATMGEGKRARHKYYLNTRNRARIVLRNYPLLHAPVIKMDFISGELRALGDSVRQREPWRIFAHLRAWFAAMGYIPRALGERRRRRAAGLNTCRFWRLVQRRPQFFPGVEFPEDGWYPAVMIDDETYHPMGREAVRRHDGGKINVLQANAYPSLHSLSIRVEQNGELIAMLNGTERHATQVDAPPGELRFIAGAIFEADETGLPYDTGGWIKVVDVL